MHLIALWNRLAPRPGGRWLFSRLVCLKAPYFATIAPRVVRLEPGFGVATMRHRRRLGNHIGTVHAIALCNLAELIGGLVCEVSTPATMRWIPRDMQVRYLKKAVGTMTASARPAQPIVASTEAAEVPVDVEIRDAADELVFTARIGMWISPRR